MNIRKSLLSVAGCLLLSIGILAETPAYILPSGVENTKQSDLLLNGKWQFKYSPESKWTAIEVPGEAVMQGYAIEHDKPFWYKKSFNLPADFKGKKVILRFDGVYSYARLTVNGKYVCDHHGGFTRWEADVTDFVKPGKNNEIALEVTDRWDEISYASGYAHHPIGGILRDVTIFALPQTHICDFRIETQLDSSYKDAVLKLSYTPIAESGAEIEYTLTAPDGQPVNLAQSRFPLKKGGENNAVNEIPVSNPLKWDAEHPNLYTLTVSLRQNGERLYQFSKKVGFRDIRIEKNRMFVNGMPVKLRGACRHDIHPTLGRTTTAELDSLDAVMFKKSNMNFVRTSHYPPSERFLEYCDKFGIYVECETAVCFVETHRQKNYAPGTSQDNPEFKERYLSQYQEMVKSFYSHPSILFWSIGNESVYGENFQQCYDWSKTYDQTRPAIFSYPGSVKGNHTVYDLLSMHYQSVDGDVEQWGGITLHNYQSDSIPVIFDEWAHPACYVYPTLQEDPNIREFWGKSLDMMWSRTFASSGALGGAVWGYIDELFSVPKLKTGTPFWKEFAKTAKPEGFQGDCVGYGEWGIVDVWRREKPEFWATKKAYSPVKILTEKITDFTAGERLAVAVHNRFNHTDLNEITILYNYRGQEKKVEPFSLTPHTKGMFIIPAEAWEKGEEITLKILSKSNEIIDISTLLLGEKSIIIPANWHGGWYVGDLFVEETPYKIVVKGNNFEIPFSKETGLIENAASNGKIFIEKGPFLNLEINLNHLTGAEVRESADKFIVSDSDWRKKEFTWSDDGFAVQVSLTGYYKEVAVNIQITIAGNGQMEINYLTDGQPNGYVREAGLKFYLPETLDRLKWERNGYWSYYPENDFAGNEGDVSFYSDNQAAYGEKPVQAWGLDTHNYYYWSDAGANCEKPLTQTAKGMKENIWYYTLSASEIISNSLTVVSKDASLACRVNKRADEQLILYVNNRWDYPEIAWGNYCKTIEALPNYGKVTVVF